MRNIILAIALVTMPGQVFAQPQVSLTSHIVVQRIVKDPAGKSVVKYEEPKLVTPGDRLVFTLDYANASKKSADNFVVTNPVPKGVSFADHESAGAQVSVDGGKTFGSLAALQVSDAAGATRAAAAADVTHIRWQFSRPIAAGEHGQLKFEGIVK